VSIASKIGSGIHFSRLISEKFVLKSTFQLLLSMILAVVFTFECLMTGELVIGGIGSRIHFSIIIVKGNRSGDQGGKGGARGAEDDHSLAQVELQMRLRGDAGRRRNGKRSEPEVVGALMPSLLPHHIGRRRIDSCEA
jgi:hypothetical protein